MVTATFLLALCSCQQTTQDVRTEIVANKAISDEEAIETLAKCIFEGLKHHTTNVDTRGNVTLDVVVQLYDTPSVTTLPGSGSAAKADSWKILTTIVFDAHTMIEYGRQRKMNQLNILLRRSAFDDQGKKVDIDIFKFAVPADRFDAFSNTGTASDIVSGGAKQLIEDTCIVEFDHLDKLQYSGAR